MKILFYISTIRGGGAARVMTNLANAFAGDTDVCFVTNFPADHEYVLDAGIRRVSLEDQESVSSKLSRNLSRIRKLRKVIREVSPDLCVSFMAENNFRLLLSAFGLAAKKVVSIRNDPNKEYPSPLSRFLAKTLYGMADGVVFQTEDARAWFPRAIRKKSTVIFNPVDPAFYQEPGEAGTYIMASGRLSKQKNYPMLLKAFSVLHEKYPSQELRIFGEGDLKGALMQMAAELKMDDAVHFEGFSQNMVENYRKAKFFVMTSDYEGMPNAILEALASSVPVISTDCPCGGPRMIIEPGKNGFLVPVGDAEAFAERMLSMMECDMDTMKRNAWASAQRFAADKVFEEWKGYFRKLI